MNLYPSKLALPLDPYTVGGYRFRQRIRRRIILWATHLGDDVVAPAGTPVRAIGPGEVVWSAVRAGSAEHRNWGGLVVVGHGVSEGNDDNRHKTYRVPPKPLAKGDNLKPITSFYSLYGHLRDLRKKVGERVTGGEEIGTIAAGNTPENGWWQTAHLHFAIYTGPWQNTILPGYLRPEQFGRTKLQWWHDPQSFIAAYNKQA